MNVINDLMKTDGCRESVGSGKSWKNECGKKIEIKKQNDLLLIDNEKTYR